MEPRLSLPGLCPICGAPDGGLYRIGARLSVWRCRICGHAAAAHAAAAPVADYHEQYPEALIAALQATRLRQAKVILERLRKHVELPDRLLDFGAGRGWFLDACRQDGLTRLAGTDDSQLSLKLLRERGFEAATDVRQLSFRPRVLTLLDVVEHFPSGHLGAIRELVQGLRPALELVVIKVPLSEGLLFRAASLLAGLGRPAPLEQLYQLGTDPPHFQYFSERSLRLFLEKLGLEEVDFFRDRDFEPRELTSRVAALRGMPRVVAGLGGQLAALVTGVTGLGDAGVLLARPTHQH